MSDQFGYRAKRTCPLAAFGEAAAAYYGGGASTMRQDFAGWEVLIDANLGSGAKRAFDPLGPRPLAGI